MKKENKPVKKVLKILAILIGGGIVICLLPLLYFVVVILYSMFIDVPSKPKEKHGEFPFELVYEYKGEQRVLKDTIVCDYEGYSWSLEGGNSRDWTCVFQNDEEYGQYYVDKENEPDLYIEIPEAADYYMGDKEFDKEYSLPILRYIDEETGLTVYSLYGKSKKPTEEMMNAIDVMTIDVQDCGSRYYTFIYTMAYCMMACADYKKPFVVFDRPNPIGANAYEGNILDLKYRSFVGYYPILQRYGLTMGEAAYLFNEEYEIGCKKIEAAKALLRECGYTVTKNNT